MFVLIVGCGRVGSSVARNMLREGHEVSCLDEDPEAHARLEVNLDLARNNVRVAADIAVAWSALRSAA